MHLHACAYQRTKKEYKRYQETRDSQYNYQKELGKVCFQHDMAYMKILKI